MSQRLKDAFMKDCQVTHVGPFDPDNAEDCWGCSSDHVEEFGECIGTVEGLVVWNPGSLAGLVEHVGPEVDVRWQPSNLRYAYHPDYLDVIE